MMLDISAVQVKIAGKPVLDNLSMAIQQGEVVGLIGAPGSGKSTLLHAIFGLSRVVSGDVLYRGRNINNRSPVESIRDGIALVAQGGQVFRQLPVEENLRLAGYTLDRRRTSERIDTIYEFFPRLKERRSQIAGSLSGGERQMLALGMGLIPQPELLLLDEPSTGLSPIMTETMLAEIKALTARIGCTVLLVEQNIKNALAISNRILTLRRGSIGYQHHADRGDDVQALLDAYSFGHGVSRC
jgi:branched-chain amino acid transport system ATP-binding protein